MTAYLTPGVFGAGGQILDQNGKTVSGGLLNIYAAGTTSQVSTFTTSQQTITTANPIVTDAGGRLPYEIWQQEGIAIKIVLTDAAANLLGNYDDLHGIGDPYAISGVALLTANNNWFGQNTFSNITANAITVTSIFASVMNVSTINVSSINASTLSVSTINASTLNVTMINVSNIRVSNMTVSGSATLFGQQMIRTVTGTITAASLGPAGASNTIVTHGLGTDQVLSVLSVSTTVNTDYMAYVVRADGAMTIYRGVLNSVTSNSPGAGGVSGAVTIGVFNNHTATQTIVTQYSIYG